MEAVPAIRAAGADLLVVLPIPPERAAAWQWAHAATDVLVAGDADRALYRALDVGRGTPRALLLDPRSWREALGELRRGRLALKHRGDDGFQLGADVVLDADGRVAFIHRPATAADRVAVAELLAHL